MLQQGILTFAMLGAEWVLWLLVALSLGCIAISIERLITLGTDGTNRAALGAAVNAFLKGGDNTVFRGKLTNMTGFEARILSAGMEMADLGPEAVEKAMTGTATSERLKMERGLAYLATVGANAPFVGLFGTVLGVIRAFHDLANDTGQGTKAVMAGISESLVATAVGLLVAIPAVVLYNGFSRWVKGRLGRSESIADLVLARLKGREHTEAPHGQ